MLSRRNAVFAVSLFMWAASLLAVDALGAQRTFVASYGNDATACALNAPCRSFGAAIAHTDPNGEVIVLDSAGYGRVTIDKSVSIVAPASIHAGVSVFSGTNGIDVAGANIVVKLRGLAISGQGGSIGVSFTQGSALYIEQCIVSDMSSEGVSATTGIVYVTDSTIRGNVGDGIRAQAGAAVVVDHSRIERNGAGVHVLNGPKLTITNSVVSGNGGPAGVHVESTNGTGTDAAISESSVSHNANAGIRGVASGAASTVRMHIARNTVAFNGGSGIFVDSPNNGETTAMINGNAIMRNLDSGIVAAGPPQTAVTLSGNAITANDPDGVFQPGNATVRTQSNNTVADHRVNDTDVFFQLRPGV